MNVFENGRYRGSRCDPVDPETFRASGSKMASSPMPSYAFRLNGRAVSVDSWDPDQPLLYVLRGALGQHAPKFGCGIGQCGACTVLVDGRAERSCQVAVSQADGRAVTTVEGLGTGGQLSNVQAAFVAEQAAQCGYCTSGMVMAATALLSQTPNPSVDQIKSSLAGNLCRCGTHTRIIRAIQRASRA